MFSVGGTLFSYAIEQTVHAFSASQWTFHFESVTKQARSNVISFCRNFASGTLFQ